MLDLILAWASLDGALGMLLSPTLQIEAVEGAESHGKMRGSMKLNEIRKVLRERNASDQILKIFKRFKRQYEQHSEPRNRVAHSHCVGFSKKDPEYMVFLPYERASDTALAVEAVSIESMKVAADWGNRLRELALKLMEPIEK